LKRSVDNSALLLYDHITDLKQRYLCRVRDDMAFIKESLAAEVIAAHTTAGGACMMKARRASARSVWDFAHSALDERLRDNRSSPRNCNGFIQKSGIKMLVTCGGDRH